MAVAAMYAFDEEPQGGTKRQGGVTKASKVTTVWLPSTTGQPPLTSIVPSIHGRSKGTRAFLSGVPPEFLLD